MMFNCVLLLALALFGVISQAYIAPVYSGVGTVGPVGPVGLLGSIGALGYNGICGDCGTTCGAGYGGAYETGHGCRTACAPACGTAAVCDTCQCLKTIVRPNFVEQIPYSCQRRVQSPSCRTGCGLYTGGVFKGASVGTIGNTCSGVYGNTGLGAIGNTCSGYLKGGYLY